MIKALRKCCGLICGYGEPLLDASYDIMTDTPKADLEEEILSLRNTVAEQKLEIDELTEIVQLVSTNGVGTMDAYESELDSDTDFTRGETDTETHDMSQSIQL